MPAAEPGRPGFVSLTELLRSHRNADRLAPIAVPDPVEAPASATDIREGESLAGVATAVADSAEAAAAIRAARLFRAVLADAFDALAAQLARDLALEVLGRELALGPADVAALARRLVSERTSQGPLRLRVAPADAHLVCDLPVVADHQLEPGDAVLECRSGVIDARLAVRLAAVLTKLTP